MDALSRLFDYVDLAWLVEVSSIQGQYVSAESHVLRSRKELGDELAGIFILTEGSVQLTRQLESGPEKVNLNRDWVFVAYFDGSQKVKVENPTPNARYLKIVLHSTGGATDRVIKAVKPFDRVDVSKWESDRLSAVAELIRCDVLLKRDGCFASVGALINYIFLRVVFWGFPEHYSSGVLTALVDSRTGPAISAVLESPGTNWGLNSLAALCDLSRTAFATTFHETAGIPPLSFVREVRMSLAVEMLLSRASSVSEIADAVGYASESAFYKAFKTTYGCSPVAYIKKTKGDGS